jgi:hypothetical protein
MMIMCLTFELSDFFFEILIEKRLPGSGSSNPGARKLFKMRSFKPEGNQSFFGLSKLVVFVGMEILSREIESSRLSLSFLEWEK